MEDQILKPHQYRVDERGCGSSASLDRAAEILAEAEYPVIISGRGTVDSDGIEEIKNIAEYLTAPVAVSYMHNDAFPSEHPLSVGPIGYMGSKAAMNTLKKADVILAVGTRLSVFGTLPCYDIDYFPKDAQIIQVDINPRQIARTHPVEVGIIGDAREASREILKRLKANKPNVKQEKNRIVEVTNEKQKWEEELVKLAMIDGTPINPRRALLELTKVLPENAIVTTDIGNVSSTANAYLKFNQSRRHIAALTFGNTGFAYPSALGAKLAEPNTPVLAIVGDGAWGMSLHEVSTAVEENIPVIACVFNNNAWCAEKKNQVDFYNNRFVGADIQNPDFAEVARSMGAVGIRVEKPEELGSAIEKAIKSNKPTVIDIQVDGTQLAPPFRKDALKMPTRLLEKYSHLDHKNWDK